jgi:hypothetical protein
LIDRGRRKDVRAALWIALKTRDCLPLRPDWRMDRPQKINFAEMLAFQETKA